MRNFKRARYAHACNLFAHNAGLGQRGFRAREQRVGDVAVKVGDYDRIARRSF